MRPHSYILATAGHVDHGKTALIRALTGTDTDRLPHEKARGITIDLGFAHLELPRCQVGIIDVPGHEDFVKNMVAGVGSIDAALLVVAADDGWMAQTEEHLQILTYLGISRGVIALTKADLVEDVEAATADVRRQLERSPLQDVAIVATAIDDRRSIDALRAALSCTLADAPPHRDVSKPRLSVDRAFTLKGVGTIVTGTLTGGTLQRGQEVVLQPVGTRTRLRALQTHHQAVDLARPGSRVALNLPDVSPASGHGPRKPNTVARGDVVTIGELGSAALVIDAVLERSPRAGDQPLRNGRVVRIHHGSAAVPARVRLFNRDELLAGDRCLARLTLQSPAFALMGDHFVLRNWSGQHTLAGGIVLDLDPPHTQAAARSALLEARATAPASVLAFVTTQLARDGWAEGATLLTRSRFAATDVTHSIKEAAEQGVLVTAGPLVVDSAAWADLLDRARQGVEAHHRAHPEQAGLPLTTFKRIVERSNPPPGLGDALLASMEQDGFMRRGSVVCRRTHQPALPPRLRPAGDRLRQVLANDPFNPPSRRQLAGDDLSVQALKFLIAGGEAVEIGPDVVLSAEAYARAIDRVRTHLHGHGPSTVSELKALLASSRRVMVPLVERLDRDGVTRRQGDRRVLR